MLELHRSFSPGSKISEMVLEVKSGAHLVLTEQNKVELYEFHSKLWQNQELIWTLMNVEPKPALEKR